MGLDLVYVYGKKRFRLNPRMAARQNLDQATADALKAKHVEMLAIKDGTKTARGPELKALAARVERVEFEMQVLWGFPRDATMHSHWLSTPGCTCPKEPNAVLHGHPARIVAQDCPLHDDAVRGDGIAVVRDRARARRDVDAVAVLGLAAGNA